jgi:hypothetical protein
MLNLLRLGGLGGKGRGWGLVTFNVWNPETKTAARWALPFQFDCALA